jgi:DNA-binding NtrC family response regulator
MNHLVRIIGQSPGITAIHGQIARLLPLLASARRPPPILLRGETGTGKSLLARSLHDASCRANGRFVAVNCAAIPEHLLESELFGFERGAFTDARHAKRGLFQEADGGTLFLDEAALLPEGLQAKLLTALDDRAVRRLGGTRIEPIDCWIIAATSTDLEQARRERRFREDLYHRLSVFTISLPPLRERGDDIFVLAEAILGRVCADYGLPPKTLAGAARRALAHYRWPGNVRELANVLERAALLADAPVITADGLGIPADDRRNDPGPADTARSEGDLRDALGDVERARLLDALERAHWNMSVAADMLGIPRNTLRYRVEKHGLTRPDQRVPRRRLLQAASASRLGRPPASAPPGPLQWETRMVTWLRVAVTSESAGERSRLLGLFAGKVAAFGGAIVQQTPESLDASFGLEASEDAPTRAANTALAIQRAVASSAQRGYQSAVTLALHASRCSVGTGNDRPWPSQTCAREADEALGTLMDSTAPGQVALSATVAPLLARRFDVRRTIPAGQ